MALKFFELAKDLLVLLAQLLILLLLFQHECLCSLLLLLKDRLLLYLLLQLRLEVFHGQFVPSIVRLQLFELALLLADFGERLLLNFELLDGDLGA